MGTVILKASDNPVGPKPASGIHAELLEEVTIAAHRLIELVALEKSGHYDGMGENFWTTSDRPLRMAEHIVKLAQQRAAELKDAAAR